MAATSANTTGASAEQPQAGASDAVVVGQVVDADTDQPIAGAVVTLRGTVRNADGQLPNARAISGGDGRFVFAELPPGAYTIFAIRPGYVPAEYGQSQPRGRSTSLQVTSAPAVTDATVRMWAYGAISGTVTDDAGDPVVGATVLAVQATMRGGRRLLQRIVGERMTDDRGMYRVANLLPGEYFVFVPARVESAATSTAAWYADERATPDAERERLQEFSESRAPSPSPHGLRVGNQIVSSMTMLASTAPMVTPDGRLEVVATTYHPSASTVSQASGVRVSSGEQRTNVDIRLSREPAYHVRGIVTGKDGPAGLLGVRLFAADIGEFATDYDLEIAGTVTDPSGRFTLLGVPAGEYVLKVLRVPRPVQTRVTTGVIRTGNASTTMSTVVPTPGAADVGDRPTLWALESVTVGDADVDEVVLQLREGARVTGRIRFEGAEAPEPETFDRFAVRLKHAAGHEDGAFLRPPSPAADGTFRTLGYPPGSYFIDFAGATPDPAARWHLKSALLGGRDLVDEPLELGAADVDGVLVTYADHLSEVSGTVRGLTGEGAALVVLLPADHRRWIANGMPSARTPTTFTDGDGRFSVANVRAGAYVALALPGARPSPDLQDPAVVARLAGLGTPVDVPDRGSASVGLSIMRVR